MSAAASNPFAPLKVNVEQPLNDLERLRREHLRYEVAVLGISWLHAAMASSIIVALALIFWVDGRGVPTSFALGLFLLTMLCSYSAICIRQFSRRARFVATLLSALCLIAFPIGTSLGACALVLLWSERGGMIFSDYYRSAMVTTPHIKRHTSIFLVALAVLLIGIAFAFFALFFVLAA
jgi:hypothetical protein